MTYKATKIVIITEKIILEGVTEIIEKAGASGYTIVTAGGKGSRGIRPSGGPLVVEEAVLRILLDMAGRCGSVAAAYEVR